MLRFLRDERGSETVEWAIIAGMFAAALVTILPAIATAVQGRFQDIQSLVEAGG